MWCGFKAESFLDFSVYFIAGLAHQVERHLAKVEVASSSLVTRSNLCVDDGFLFCLQVLLSVAATGFSGRVLQKVENCLSSINNGLVENSKF